MRFDDPTQPEEEPIRSESIVPPLDRTSRAIHIKLAMLFGMLILVVYMMTEAGKPERWEWMGFDETANPADEVSSNSGDAQPPMIKNEQPADAPFNTEAVPNSKPIVIANGEFGQTSTTNRSVNAEQFESDYPIAANRFWQATIRQLSGPQLSDLMRLIKHIRNGESAPEQQQESASQLVRLLKNNRDQFHQEMFDKLALSSDGTEEKTRLANEMFESQELWEKQILPALESASRGEEFTISQLKSVERLQAAIDPMLFGLVEDKTSIGWAGDSAAWKRIWEVAIEGDLVDAPSVTRIEMMGQPDVYRGKPVQVEGWIRRARKETLGPDSELGLPHYYVLWVRPRETKLGPFCVYAMNVPDELLPLDEADSSVNMEARIQGYFFKVRNYLANGTSVENCPVIISPSIEHLEKTKFTAVTAWNPSRPAITTAFIIIPLFATGVAWFVFRTSRSRPYVPGKKMKSHIDQTLNNLADDPLVQTDRDNILALYESESFENE